MIPTTWSFLKIDSEAREFLTGIDYINCIRFLDNSMRFLVNPPSPPAPQGSLAGEAQRDPRRPARWWCSGRASQERSPWSGSGSPQAYDLRA